MPVDSQTFLPWDLTFRPTGDRVLDLLYRQAAAIVGGGLSRYGQFSDPDQLKRSLQKISDPGERLSIVSHFGQLHAIINLWESAEFRAANHDVVFQKQCIMWARVGVQYLWSL